MGLAIEEEWWVWELPLLASRSRVSKVSLNSHTQSLDQPRILRCVPCGWICLKMGQRSSPLSLVRCISTKRYCCISVKVACIKEGHDGRLDLRTTSIERDSSADHYGLARDRYQPFTFPLAPIIKNRDWPHVEKLFFIFPIQWHQLKDNSISSCENSQRKTSLTWCQEGKLSHLPLLENPRPGWKRWSLLFQLTPYPAGRRKFSTSLQQPS